MEERGWVKLHRKILSDPIFTSEKGLKIWVWCLLKSNHKDTTVFLDRQKVNLTSGQFVFGRESASEKLKMSPSTVWSWIKRLETDNYIDIKSTNKFSVITIKNWTKYQSFLTTDKQLIDTDNNDKNDKKIDVISKKEITNILRTLSVSRKITKQIVNNKEFLDEKFYLIVKISANEEIRDKAAYIVAMYEQWRDYESQQGI